MKLESFIPMDQLRTLTLRGDDVIPYLHTKLATDVRSWRDAAGGLAMALDINGRIIGAGRLLRAAEPDLGAWVWIVPAPHHAQLRDHLDRYVIMEDVTTELDEDRRWALLPRSALEALELEAPAAEFGIAMSRDSILVAGRGIEPLHGSAVLVGVPSELYDKELERWTSLLGPSPGVEALDDAQITAQFADFPSDMYAEETIPLEAGAWAWIGLNKGCYLGQEIVERLFSRGRPNKRLMTLRWKGGVVAPRHNLVAGGRENGWITRATRDGDQVSAMGYVRRRWLDKRDSPLTLEGSEVEVEVLDYVGGEGPPPEVR